jgi:hypothetical protein
MKGMKPPSAHTVLDGLSSEPELQQLPSRDRPVLPPNERPSGSLNDLTRHSE